MGMSTYVYGIIPADEKFKKMKAIYDLCTKQGVEVPKEVEDFFDNEPPSDKGVQIDLKDTVAVEQYDNDYQSGYDIHVDDLPDYVKIIRVVNSW